MTPELSRVSLSGILGSPSLELYSSPVGVEPDKSAVPKESRPATPRPVPVLSYARPGTFKRQWQLTANHVAGVAAGVVGVAGLVGILAHTIGHNPNALGVLMIIPIWLGGIVYIVARIGARQAGGLAKGQMIFSGLLAYWLGIYLLLKLLDFHFMYVAYIMQAEPFLGDVFRCLIVALSWYAIVDGLVLVRGWMRRPRGGANRGSHDS